MTHQKESKLDSPLVSFGLLIILLLAIVSAWLWLPGYLSRDQATLADKGLLGDSYGAVNALFTGLAFAGLVFTIFLQQREIKLQREDFKQTLREYKQSAEAAVEQSKALKRSNELNMLREEISITKIFIDRLSEAIITANPSTNRGLLQIATLETLSQNRIEDALSDLKVHFRELQVLQKTTKSYENPARWMIHFCTVAPRLVLWYRLKHRQNRNERTTRGSPSTSRAYLI